LRRRSALAFAITGDVALFSGLLVMQATLAFWTVEGLEVAGVLTYRGQAAAQYPMNVCAAWLRDL
jgi:ABC-2 type transport system permease protein